MTKALQILLPILLIGNITFAQNVVKGTIKDSKGQTLPGATIAVRGTKSATVADANGNFRINVSVQPPLFLRATFVGYKPQDFQVLRFDDAPIQLTLVEDALLEEIVVTARRRSEVAQNVPIPITVIGGQAAENSGAFNVNRLKELVPSVQLYASNARNTTLNIRGLGSTFGLTNDGIDPGVGFYVDGVYHARPAATSTDFIDIEQIEVVRGPQGTLFGKNTTAGAFNITTRKPSFIPSSKAELSFGSYNFLQAKATITGPISKDVAVKLSLSGTQRDGTIWNPNEERAYSGQNNVGVKGQVLYRPSEDLEVLVSGDASFQHPAGYPLVVAGVTPTLRSAHRQYAQIVSDLGYQQPKIDPFSREIYTNTPWRHNQSIGGASVNIDKKIGGGTLTSTTAWRFWNWDPTNDRDFTEFSALTKSQGNTRHDQYSQEFRYAGNITDKLSGVVGLFVLGQNLQGLGQTEEVGSDQWRFVQTSSTGNQALYNPINTPDLLDGFGIRTNSSIKSLSAAVFGQVDWEFANHFHVLPGIRFTYDKKDVDYDRQTYGGLDVTGNATLQALKNAVYTNQAFNTSTDNNNLSGNLTLAYRPLDKFSAFATFSTGYKPVGVNVGGLPTLPDGSVDLSLAVIKPEYVQHYELGIKSRPALGAILNITAFNTDIKDYQTNVQSPQLGVNRGYLSNAEKVRVKGFEIDGSYQVKRFLTLNAAVAYLDGKYVSFTNAPLPLEETGYTENNVQVAFKDASGGRLPGISKWNVSGGAELSTLGNLLSKEGRFFIAADASYRSDYSSNPTPSKVLVVDAYSLLNGRLGFRSDKFSIFVWGRNITNTNYFEQLQAAAGNAGLYAGVLGDPRTYGATLRLGF